MARKERAIGTGYERRWKALGTLLFHSEDRHPGIVESTKQTNDQLDPSIVYLSPLLI